MSKDPLLEEVLRKKNDLIDLLVKMVEIPTVSPSGDNYLGYVSFMNDYFRERGFSVEIIDVPQEFVDKNVPPEGRGKKRVILLARVGSNKNIVLHFNGHYDVVPGGPGWTVTEPFKPLIKGDRIYGRGTTDMKGGIASAIVAMEIIGKYAEKEDFGVEIALVPDEEIGGLTGTGYLVSRGAVRSRYVVIVEPSGIDRIYIGHKGSVWGRVIVKGKTAHGSTPWLGVNAFEKTIELVYEIMRRIIPELNKKKSKYEYDLPEGNIPTLTLGGYLKGGEKTNQVPGEVIFSFDRRVIVEENAEEVWRELREEISKVAKEKNIDVEITLEQISQPVLTDSNSKIIKALERSGEEVLGKPLKKIVCIGGLDMRFYAEKKYEVATYGPGALGTAHAPDEYVEISDLVKASQVYIRLIQNLFRGYV
ncbi:MAG: M20 family metallopeptidase [Sulfolobales archaeon]